MERGYLRTRLGQVHYRAAGDGEVVLLIHQSGRSSRMFDNVLPLLAARHRAVAIDLPGFGNSCSLPPGATIEQLADCCADVIRDLGVDGAHVYGHHSGNKIATALAVRNPELVRSLILAGQSHSIIPDQEQRNAAIDKFVKPYREAEGSRDAARTRAEKWALTFRTVTNAWWSPGIASAAAPSDIQHAAALAMDAIQSFEGSAALYGANLAYDLGANYARITAKTLILEIVTAEEDRVFGRQGGTIQQMIPGSRLSILEHEDGDGVTLEDRADDLAAIMMSFFGALQENRDTAKSAAQA